MYNPAENPFIRQGSVKYYSPTELSRICRQNIEPISIRESEKFFKKIKHTGNVGRERYHRKLHHEKSARNNSELGARKKEKRERRKHREACFMEMPTYEQYYRMTCQEADEKRGRRHKKHRIKEFSELNYQDLQYLIDDYNRDMYNIPQKLLREEYNDQRRYQRSRSIDQIPTRDVTLENRNTRRFEGSRSVERKSQIRSTGGACDLKAPGACQEPFYEMNDEIHHRYFPQNDELLLFNQTPKRRKGKVKKSKKKSQKDGLPEFIPIEQLNEQTINLQENNSYEKWYDKKETQHHQQRDFFKEYHVQRFQENTNFLDHNGENICKQNMNNENDFLQPPFSYYNDDLYGNTKHKRREKRKEKSKDRKIEHAEEGYNEFPKHTRIKHTKDKKLNAENYRNTYLETDSKQDNTIYKTEYKIKSKKPRKDLVSVHLEPQEIPPKPPRKKHEQKRDKIHKVKVSSENLRLMSLSVDRAPKEKSENFEEGPFQTGLKIKYKSESSINSLPPNNKDIVCLYRNNDSPDQSLKYDYVKEHGAECESLSLEKCLKQTEMNLNSEKTDDKSVYNKNETVFCEHKEGTSEVLSIQQRKELFEKALKRGFPTRPRPRLSRSRRKSSRILGSYNEMKSNIGEVHRDEESIKEVHCYDVGTSTLLDNNFGDVLELLKGEGAKSHCSDKKRSVFHVKKKTSKDECVHSEDTLGIIVKGIEPPKKIYSCKARHGINSSPKKNKINRLECKLFSVVAITPGKLEDKTEELKQTSMKTMSTPAMQHRDKSEIRNPSSDKRLERLLKYYKVQPQSRIEKGKSDGFINFKPTDDSRKSLKDLITSKLADYLKKIQEEESFLEFQTDDPIDPKVLKLVLPIECNQPEHSKVDCQAHRSITRIPRESFSDLYMNYTDINEMEEEDQNAEKISVKENELVKVNENNITKFVEFFSGNTISACNEKPQLNSNPLSSRQADLNQNGFVCSTFSRLRPKNTSLGGERDTTIEIENQTANHSTIKPFCPNVEDVINLLCPNSNIPVASSHLKNTTCYHMQEERFNQTENSKFQLNLKDAASTRVPGFRIHNNRQQSTNEQYSEISNLVLQTNCCNQEPFNTRRPKSESHENCSPQTKDTATIHTSLETSLFENATVEKSTSMKERDSSLIPKKDEATHTSFANRVSQQTSLSNYSTGANETEEKPRSLRINFISNSADNKNNQIRTDEEHPVNKEVRRTKYFEIPLPKIKNSNIKRSTLETKEVNGIIIDPDKRSPTIEENKSTVINPDMSCIGSKNHSSIPQRITKTLTSGKVKQPDTSNFQVSFGDSCFVNALEQTFWEKQGLKKEEPNNDIELDNSFQKCLNWNVTNSATVVMSDFAEIGLNTTSKIEDSAEVRAVIDTDVPKKSQIPVAKKDRVENLPIRTSNVGPDNNTTLFLTKTYNKTIRGQTSLERRKQYDSKIRNNVKKRSLSECSGVKTNLPRIYEVRYMQIYDKPGTISHNQPSLKQVKSDNDLSCYSGNTRVEFWKPSTDSLSTAPSCFLKRNKYGIVEKKSNILEKSKKKLRINIKDEFIDKGRSSREERIQELIRENLLFAKYTTSNNIRDNNKSKKSNQKVKGLSEVKGLGFKMEKVNNNKQKGKLTVKCCKRSPGDDCRKFKVVTKLGSRQRNENEVENFIPEPVKSMKSPNLTKLSFDKVNDNELCVFFENQKLSKVESSGTKSILSFISRSHSYDQDSVDDNSVSSKSTVINCKINPRATVKASKVTTGAFASQKVSDPHSGFDSGYLTKGGELNYSGTTFDSSTRRGEHYCKSIYKSSNSKFSLKTKPISEDSKWNQKDLIQLKNRLLFPDAYDDFEISKTAKNTELIKYYVESANVKLKNAIDSIIPKENMSLRSRSVMSLPSVRMIPEENSESGVNGDISSENYPTRHRKGGFYNYQKFVMQNNAKHSSEILSKIHKTEDYGDGTESVYDDELSEGETASIKTSSSLYSVSAKTSVSMKKSVIELFKMRPSSVKIGCSNIHSQDTLIAEDFRKNDKTVISDKDFFNNFHQIMALECQKFAKKVKDQSQTKIGQKVRKFEEIPLGCLLKKKNSLLESTNCMETEYQLASEEVTSTKNIDSSTINDHNRETLSESSKSVTCISDNRDIIKEEEGTKKCQTLWKNISSAGTSSKFNMDFYPEEKSSILGEIKNSQISSVSTDILSSSPSKKTSLRGLSRQSEKQFFDKLLAFYDKESDLIKKLIRDNEFFVTLTETLRSSEDSTSIFNKEFQKKNRKEKKKGLFSRFFKRKDKKINEALVEVPSIGLSLEFAKSLSGASSGIARESCYSFYRELDNIEKEISKKTSMKISNSEYLQKLAYKAKCHLEPMVKATMSNRHINDKIKLAGFLKLLEMVAKGDFTLFNNCDDTSLEGNLKIHVADMFDKVYRIANREVSQQNTILDNDKIQMLKILVTKYHMGIDTHINILAIYIGRGLIRSRPQLEDAILYLMGLDTQEVNLELFEQSCGVENQVDGK